MDPNSLYIGLAGIVFVVAGIDIGVAFIIRGQREASGPDDRY